MPRRGHHAMKIPRTRHERPWDGVKRRSDWSNEKGEVTHEPRRNHSVSGSMLSSDLFPTEHEHFMCLITQHEDGSRPIDPQ